MIKLTARLRVDSCCSCSFSNLDPRMLDPETTLALEERTSKVAERSFIVLLACLIMYGETNFCSACGAKKKYETKSVSLGFCCSTSLETKSPDQCNLDVHDTKNREQEHILEQDQDSSSQ